MNRYNSAYTFTGEEKNIIRRALIELMKSMEDENGEVDHLSPYKKEEYSKINELYFNF